MAWQDRAYNRSDGTDGLRLGFMPPSRMALIVIAACVAGFVLQSFSPLVTIWGKLTFTNHLAWIQPWRWITYQYLHDGVGHIFWNLLGIYFFLCPLERLWGWQKAFAFYTLGGIAAGLSYGILTLFASHPAAGLIGASGSILACLGACALLFPEQQILLIVFFVPIRALAILLGLYYVLTVIWSADLSNAAHLGGLIFGVCAAYWGGPLWRKVVRNYNLFQIRRATEAERDEETTVDRILHKVSEQGMNSLTRGERKALKRATERQRLAELSKPRRGL